MADGLDGEADRPQRSRDSIWERYLTGKLSLDDNETLRGLIEELHQEIAQHIGKKADAKNPEPNVEPQAIRGPTTPPVSKPTTIFDVVTQRSHIAKRGRIDPQQN